MTPAFWDCPGRLWSLLDMQQFFSRKFYEDLQFLFASRNLFFKESPEAISDDRASYLQIAVASLKPQAELMGFVAVVKELDHLDQMMRFRSITPVPGYKVSSAIDSIHRHALEAFQTGAFMFIAADKAQWHCGLIAETAFPTDKPRWGRKEIDANVRKSFGAAIPELELAGNCYATENNTASVFHLMRAVEHGLRVFAVAVGNQVGVLPFDYQEWQQLIDGADKQWKASVDTWGKSAEQINARAFFKRIIADLHAFKDEVRNVTAHTRGSYDAPGALSIRNRVDAWFSLLASKAYEGMASGALLDRSLFTP
jgi:hypothetical protein